MMIWTVRKWKTSALLTMLCLVSETSFSIEPLIVEAPASAVASSAKAKTAIDSTPIQVTALDGTSTADETQVNIHFDRKPSFDAFDIEAHGTFLQIPLRHSLMAKPGEFINVQSPFINKLVGFQHADDRSSVRLFVNQEASLVKKAIQNETIGNMISLKLDHKQLGQILASDPSVTAQPPSVPTASEVVATAKVVEKPAIAPAELIKSEAVEESNVGVGRKDKASKKIASAVGYKKSNDLNGKITKAAIFCAIMFFGLIVVYLSKPYLRKRLQGGRKHDVELAGIVMKTLATQRVNSKQRIELMEIAGEKILLAISADQVNYLTTIARPQQMMQSMAAESGVTLNSTRAIPQRQSLQPKNLVEQKPKQSAPVASTRAVSPESAVKQQRQRVQVEVGEEIKMSYEKKPQAKAQEAITDVTRLIREKLKSLPSI